MKKIMFNDKYGLTTSVLNGTKTMTRRIVSDKSQKRYDRYDYCCRKLCERGATFQRMWEDEFYPPYCTYKVGEVVAVAQNYQEAIYEFNRLGDKAGWGRLIANTENGCEGYYNKMFVRADLMPHRIRITDVRVERLQDITDEDCGKEGIDYVGGYSESYYFGHGVGNVRLGNSPREAFAALIDKVSGKGTWERNPWVFVYTFERIDLLTNK